MFYIHQLHTPSFPIAFVKTESDFIVRSVETGLGRWMLVVAVISVDAYPFFGFLRPNLSPWGYRNRCFLVALCPLIVRRLNLKIATKRLLHQQVKIPGQFKCRVYMGVHPYSYFWWCGYFWGPSVLFVTIDEFSVRVTKIPSRIDVSWNHSLPFPFSTYFKSVNYGHIIERM